jgi:hypothetical protein
MSNRKDKEVATSYWMKEMQRCIALSCMDTVYSMDGMKLKNMQTTMEQLFHGNGSVESLSYVNLCLEGKSQFAYLWEEASDNSPSLLLKRSILRSSPPLTSDSGFPIVLLRRSTLSGTEIIAGRKLMDSARLCLLNLKKAYAYALEFLGPPPLHEYKSGTNESDLDEYVLEKMEKDLAKIPKKKGCGNDEIELDIDITEAATASTGKGGKFFPGWVAFKCFGPTAPEKYRTTLLELGDYTFENSRTEAGRGFARKSSKASAPGSGPTTNESNCKKDTNQLSTEARAIANAALKQQQHSNKLMSIASLITSCNQEIASGIQLLQYIAPSSVNFNLQMDEIKKTQASLKKHKQDLEDHVADKKQKLMLM